MRMKGGPSRPLEVFSDGAGEQAGETVFLPLVFTGLPGAGP